MFNQLDPRPRSLRASLLSLALHLGLIAMLAAVGRTVVDPQSAPTKISTIVFAPVRPLPKPAVRVKLTAPPAKVPVARLPIPALPANMPEPPAALPRPPQIEPSSLPVATPVPAVALQLAPPPNPTPAAPKLPVFQSLTTADSIRPRKELAQVRFDEAAAAANASRETKLVASTGFDTSSVARSNLPKARIDTGTGFGSLAGLAEPTRARQPQPATAAFGQVQVASTRSSRAVAGLTDSPANTPLEVLHKPRPAYTPEARRLQLEGEVLVEVLFAASGSPEVVRVLRGLGHGLDENAITAARAIRFKPAQRNGVPVDVVATVHIRFELAY